jgi:hypothetical protein
MTSFYYDARKRYEIIDDLAATSVARRSDCAGRICDNDARLAQGRAQDAKCT